MNGNGYLTDPDVKNARAKDKAHKLSDGQGMYLLVKPDGGKYWRFKYRYAGKEKLLALGVYPDTTLKAARTKRGTAREQLANGLDPGAERKASKVAKRRSAENTFEAVAGEWYDATRNKWSDAHAKAVLNRLETDLYPYLGKEPIESIDTQRMLEVLRKIEARGALELLSKTRVIAGQVFRYGIGGGRLKADPTRDLKGQFQAQEKRHYARLSEADLPVFLKKLEEYDGNKLTLYAMRLLVLTFVRTGELRGAKWPEFDIEKRQWRIPAERMKSGAEHIVPLSDQAIDTLGELEKISGAGELVFPNEHNPKKPMSENTILYALYRMGYRSRATGHGFRATASTILNEQGWDADVIERQLAHKEANTVRAAYHHSQYLEERARMMQAWADFLAVKRVEADEKETKVVNLRRKRA